MLKGRGLEVSTNKPLRDGGITLWEGGIRVPFLIRYPGKIPAGKTWDEPFVSLDLLPTIVQLAGGTLEGEPVLDGENVWSDLTEGTSTRERTFYFGFRNYSAVREGKYKIVREQPQAEFQLFDLSSDVSESEDLSNAFPKLKMKLVQKFEEWQSQFDN